MRTNAPANPAELAAQEALQRMCDAIDEGKSFLFEAGAGAGKTESLVRALRYLIDKQGNELRRRQQQVACITYTNVASNEIASRTDRHPAVLSSTIHSFCWSLIKDFQSVLRQKLPQLSKWPERLADAGEIGVRRVHYDLGYPVLTADEALLGHDDVLALAVELMELEKFRRLFLSRYPILLIDEYQDTDKGFAEALARHFLGTDISPLLGFFGDHWQKIYSTGCGNLAHAALTFIGMKANFRSVKAIVDVLNRMRPELPQEVVDPSAKGSVAVYHSNAWVGERRKESHWAGDLPADIANQYLATLIAHLQGEGWDFSPDKTKVLMLTHNLLATEQGYSKLAAVFPNKDMLVRKEDSHIEFFVDTLEPVCTAYETKRFGEMFTVLDRLAASPRSPSIRSYADKADWTKDMDMLMDLRRTGTVGAVLDHLLHTKRPRVPETVESKERELQRTQPEPDSEEPSSLKRLRALRDVPYQEVVRAARFIDGHTPFSTKHGVKGDEFENVLVVFGRGWNLYNFNQFLEWAGPDGTVPSGRMDTFERNRNLFYVVCSRPRKRLALLFTQHLSDGAMATLAHWFGNNAIHPLQLSV